MRWRTANRRHKHKTRVLSMHDLVTRWGYRIYRAHGLNHEQALDWATPRYLYPVLTPIPGSLPRKLAD